jgi:diacylglycerol kinase (ATP)
VAEGRRAYFILNPCAGRGRAKRAWECVRATLVDGRGWGFRETEGEGHATKLARAAAEDGWERVIAIGGDGTVSEVAAGVIGTESAMAVVPGGRGNDFARSTQIPMNPFVAGRLARRGVPRRIDVGEVEAHGGSRYFLTVAGLGFDAEVVRTIQSHLVGQSLVLPYMLAVLATVWRYEPRAVVLTLDKGRQIGREVLVVAVANCRFYGGGLMIAPEAQLDDGLFEVCVIGRVGRVELLNVLPRMAAGGHRDHPQVEFFRCRELEAISPVRVRSQADGELVGELPARFVLHANAVRCVLGGRPRPVAVATTN